MPLSLEELHALHKRERRGLIWRMGLFVAAFVPSIVLAGSENSVRLYTVAVAPSYMPTWIQEYWQVSGALIGALLVLAIGVFVQLFRMGQVQRQIVALTPNGTSPNLNASETI
jgi:hypothetical protein